MNPCRDIYCILKEKKGSGNVVVTKSVQAAFCPSLALFDKKKQQPVKIIGMVKNIKSILSDYFTVPFKAII